MDDTPAHTILLVEDDPALALGLVDTLQFEGFHVVHAPSGEAALAALTEQEPDCIILDLMLPGMNGYQVCTNIRSSDAVTPIIMLTARGQEADKIRGLDAGADDYVTKPFSVGELVARVRAAIRRRGLRTAIANQGGAFKIGAITIDPSTQTIARDGEAIPISFYEAELLKLLHEHKGTPVSREEILERVWGTKAHTANNRSVDNFVVKLRKKIEPNGDERPRHILTVYGYGYKLVP